MNVIPWRKREGPLTTENEFEDIWKGLWEPFAEGKNRLPTWFQARNLPPMNVSETEGHFCVSIELPGMEVKDIEIDLMGNQLTVSGERKWETDKKGKEFHRVESWYGNFSRSLTLPETLRIDRDAIQATFEKGVLEIRIPKLEPTPAAKIKIQAR